MAPDITYLTTGLFTSFYPESKEGEQAYSEFLEQNEGNNKIFTIHLKTVLYQFRKAGYIVRKAKKPTQSIDEILNELDQL